MAEETTTKKTTKSTGSTRSSSRTKSTATTPAAEPKVETPIIPKDIDVHDTVTVRNGFQGKLVYKSPRSGEKYVWESFGDEQEMELAELKNARNSSRAFFEKNWFMFDEAWIPDYLGVARYYKYALKIEDFDKLFDKSISELEKILATMSDGQKKSVAYRARKLIADGTLDSRKMIAALEKQLGVELVEK